MMDNVERKFIESVKSFVRCYPHLAPYVVQASSSGVEEALKDAKERACDMESALVSQLSSNSKAKKALPYLQKWFGKTSLDWEWIFKNNGLL